MFLDSLRFHAAALGGLDGTVAAVILNGMFRTVDPASRTLSELELQVCFQSLLPGTLEVGRSCRAGQRPTKDLPANR